MNIRKTVFLASILSMLEATSSQYLRSSVVTGQANWVSVGTSVYFRGCENRKFRHRILVALNLHQRSLGGGALSEL